MTLHERINLRSWLAPVVVLKDSLIRLPINEALGLAYAVTGRPLSEAVKRPRPVIRR